MLTRLRFAIVAVFVFPALVVAQEKVMLQMEYPEGKYLINTTQQDVAYDSFIRGLFDFRSNEPRESARKSGTTLHIGPPDEKGVVRVDFEALIDDIADESEDTDDILTPEERQQQTLEENNHRRIIRESKVWMLLNPNHRQILEVHGNDEVIDKTLETNPFKALEEPYQKSFKRFYGNEITRKTQESNLRFYPGRLVTVGEQWTSPQIVSVPIIERAELEMTGTLKEIKTDSEGRKIAVIESRSAWKTDDPDKYGPYDTEYSQVEVYYDAVAEWDIETGIENSIEKKIKVVAKRRIDYDVGSFLVVSVAKRTETSTVERIP